MPKVIHSLLEGYKKFRQTYFGDQENFVFKKLVQKGQRPEVMLIACSDSRVDPAIIFDANPGDLFVVRNVANLVPPFENDRTTHHGTSAALEFAVCGLGVKHIIVLGHSLCGGIEALVESSAAFSAHSFIGDWMELAKPAKQNALKKLPAEAPLQQKVDSCTQHALVDSKNNLLTFPWIKENIEAGKLRIHAWFFDIERGILYAYDEKQGSFEDMLESKSLKAILQS